MKLHISLLILSAGLLASVACSDGSTAEPTPAMTATPSATATAVRSPTATSTPPTPTATHLPPTRTPVVSSVGAVNVGDSPVGGQLNWVKAVNRDDLTEEEVASHFTSSFADQASAAQIIGIFGQIRTAAEVDWSLAGIQGNEQHTQMVALITAGDLELAVQIVVKSDDNHRIDVLSFTEPPNLDDPPGSWAELQNELAAEASQVSLLAAEVTSGSCERVFGFDEDRVLAIGSAFKLYVLGELARQIDEGLVSWEEPLVIREDIRSFGTPGESMDDAAAGTVLSLKRYAELMISISDNTATDHLIDRLGRANVEASMARLGHSDPALNIPFLTTRQFVLLKLALSPEQRAAYLELGSEGRRGFLNTDLAGRGIDDAVANAAELVAPVAIESIEWFASPADLSRAMVWLHQAASTPGLEPLLDILSINPGVPFDKRVWPFVGYKGGSEPGVLAVSWLLERNDGRLFFLAGIHNDSAALIDQSRAIFLISVGADLLAEES